MSHHIYHTTGLIVAQKAKGESDILLKIFTPDFGMILATAQGARKLESKTRFGLSLYTIPEIDLIKTKDNFRVGAVRPEPKLLTQSDKKLRAKISAILLRFVVSDEPNKKLYQDILNVIDDNPANSDLVAMLVILSNLGYWKLNDFEKEFIKTGLINSLEKKTLINNVNQVVSHIHL